MTCERCCVRRRVAPTPAAPLLIQVWLRFKKRTALHLLQLRIFSFGLLQNGDVGVSLRQSHPAQQVGVAGIGVNAFEFVLYLNVRQIVGFL